MTSSFAGRPRRRPAGSEGAATHQRASSGATRAQARGTRQARGGGSSGASASEASCAPGWRAGRAGRCRPGTEATRGAGAIATLHAACDSQPPWPCSWFDGSDASCAPCSPCAPDRPCADAAWLPAAWPAAGALDTTGCAVALPAMRHHCPPVRIITIQTGRTTSAVRARRSNVMMWESLARCASVAQSPGHRACRYISSISSS